MWNQTYGGVHDDYGYSVILTSEGYVLSGSTSSFCASESDGWLIKTDSFGNILWNQTYGGPNEDYISSAIKAVDEGYTLVGYTLSFGAGGSDAWLINTDSTGNLKWNQTFGGQKYEYGGSLIKTNDNSFIIAGSVLDSPSDFESSDFLVIKIEGKNIIEIEIFWLIIGIIFVILIIFGYVKFRNMKK